MSMFGLGFVFLCWKKINNYLGRFQPSYLEYYVLFVVFFNGAKTTTKFEKVATIYYCLYDHNQTMRNNVRQKIVSCYKQNITCGTTISFKRRVGLTLQVIQNSKTQSSNRRILVDFCSNCYKDVKLINISKTIGGICSLINVYFFSGEIHRGSKF